MMLRFLIAVLALTMGFVAVRAQQQVLKPGDKVNLKCVEDDALNGDYVITEAGLILLQYIGAVEVKGLSEAGAADKISKALVSQQILRKATITVRIQVRGKLPVTIGGAVKKAGEYAWTEGLTLLQLLAKAEPLGSADLTAVRITRGPQTTSTPADTPLQSGDKIFVPLQVGTKEITVIGAVKNPGTFQFKQGMRLSDAIKLAGGLRSDAARERVEIRWAIGGSQVVSLDGTDEPLSAGDEVVVPIAEVREKIYVRGAIAKPGLIAFTAGITVSKAVGDASPVQGARLDAVKVLRKTPDGKNHTYKVNLKKVAQGTEQDWPLVPGDVVDVPYPSSNYSTQSTMKAVTIGLLLLFLFR